MIPWKHIMDEQPEHDELIIQCHPSYEGHYTIGMRKYYQKCTFQEVLDFEKKHDIKSTDFCWVYAKDFPFPDFDARKNDHPA